MFTTFERTKTQASTTSITDPMQDRFGSDYQLPAGFRDEARGMSWSLFTATYCPDATIRIGNLEGTRQNLRDAEFTCEVTRFSKIYPPETTSHEMTGTGPTSTCSHMLGEFDRYVEITEFHQHDLFEATVTMIKVAHQHNRRHTACAIGFGATPEDSIASAMSSAAERIYG